MKAIKISLSLLAAALFTMIFACKDESLNPVPAWETGVFGKAAFTKNAISKKDTLNAFLIAKPAQAVKITHFWESLDKLNTVTKIDFYVYWNESYTDKNGIGRTARHTGFVFEDPGKLWKTVASPAANHAEVEYDITQADIYNLVKDTEFDYGNGKVKVIDDVKRTAANPFTAKDAFTIRWKLTTADGRTFDRWGPDSVCDPLANLGSNCQIDFSVK